MKSSVFNLIDSLQKTLEMLNAQPRRKASRFCSVGRSWYLCGSSEWDFHSCCWLPKMLNGVQWWLLLMDECILLSVSFLLWTARSILSGLVFPFYLSLKGNKGIYRGTGAVVGTYI